jgi:endo-1,4-beta-xylanase
MITWCGIVLLWLFGGFVKQSNHWLDGAAVLLAQRQDEHLVAQAMKTEIPRLRDVATSRGVFIGAATEAIPLLREPSFAAMMAGEFNMLATENRLKFNIIHPARDRYDFSQGDAIVNFARANGMQVRGHCLVWHEHFPPWLAMPGVTTTTVEQAFRDHIRTVMRHYRGKLQCWDVVNEAIADDGKMRDTKWRGLLGADYIENAFKWAREADPEVKLFINDFGVETMCPKSDRYYTVIRDLLARGVPIDGIGFQMHLNLGAGLSTTSLNQNLQRFAALGLDIHITEMDVSLDRTGVTSTTLERQAEMYREVLKVAFSFPEVKAVIFWGASDRHSWLVQPHRPKDAPLLFDDAMQPKPAFRGVLQALTMNRGR